MTSGLDIVGPAGNIPDALIVPLITHTARLVFDSNSAVTNTDTIKNINTSAGTSTSYGVPLSELKPALRIYAIIKAIELQYNLTFCCKYFRTKIYVLYPKDLKDYTYGLELLPHKPSYYLTLFHYI